MKTFPQQIDRRYDIDINPDIITISTAEELKEVFEDLILSNNLKENDIKKNA